MDKNDNNAYFIYDFENQIKVIGYNVDRDSMFILPVALDSSRFYNTSFKVKWKNLTMGGGDDPQLSVIGDKLVVSYPSFSDILVYDINAGLQQTYTSESNSYPSQKNIRKIIEKRLILASYYGVGKKLGRTKFDLAQLVSSKI